MNDMMPELTLETAPAPTLTLEPKVEEKPIPKPDEAEQSLSPQELKMVDDFAQKIDLTNSTQILQYGAGSQKKVADFSSATLENIRTKDLGEIGDMVTGLVTELKGFDAAAEDPRGFSAFSKKRRPAGRNENEICQSGNKRGAHQRNAARPSGAAAEGHRHARQNV